MAITKDTLGKRIIVPNLNIETAGCAGYGEPIILQQTDTGSPTPITDAAFAPYGSATSIFDIPNCNVIGSRGYIATGKKPVVIGSDCQETVGAFSPNVYVPPGSVEAENVLATMYRTAEGEAQDYVCGNGRWVVNQKACGGLLVLPGDMTGNVVWTDTWILKLDVDNIVQKVIGHTNINDGKSFGNPTTGLEGMFVDGVGTVFGTGDSVAILLIFSYYCNYPAVDYYYYPDGNFCASASSGGSGGRAIFFGAQLARNQQIITPMYDRRAAFIGKRIFKGDKSKGQRDVVAVPFGCGTSRMGKTIFTGTQYPPGTDHLITDRKDVTVGIADCCPRESASGSQGVKKEICADYCAYCGVGYPCSGGFKPPGKLYNPDGSLLCDLTGWPSTLYFNKLSAIGAYTYIMPELAQNGTVCFDFDSVTVPMYWLSDPTYVPDGLGGLYNPLSPYKDCWFGMVILPDVRFTGLTNGFSAAGCDTTVPAGFGAIAFDYVLPFYLFFTLTLCYGVEVDTVDTGAYTLEIVPNFQPYISEITLANNRKSLSHETPAVDLVFGVTAPSGPFATITQ